MEELLHFTRQRHRVAEIAERLAGGIELLLSLFEPVLQFDVVRTAVALINVQLIGAIDRDGLLHVLE